MKSHAKGLLFSYLDLGELDQFAGILRDHPELSDAVRHGTDRFGNPTREALVHVAAREGLPDFMAMLLEAGAETEAVDLDGLTPLWTAVDHGHDICAAHLVEHDADVHAVGEFKQTPLHRAAARRGSDRLVWMLLEAGADVDARDDIGQTPLHVAADQCCPENFAVLLERSPALEARDDEGMTPLHLAACYTLEGIGPLLAAGADAMARDARHRTPLHLAASHTPEGIELLLAAGADATARDSRDRTPLHAAVTVPGGAAAAAALLDAGADVNARDEHGVTPLHMAAVYGTAGDGGTMTVLIARGGDVNAVDESGRTPLGCAAARGPIEAVEWLLGAGADPAAADDNGTTPLHAVAGRKRINRPAKVGMIMKLVEAGAEANARDGWERTPHDLLAALKPADLGDPSAERTLSSTGKAWARIPDAPPPPAMGMVPA